MEMHERLRAAREAAGYRFAADAARAFGWNYVTYSKNESGFRGIPASKIIRYASAFKVAPAWLLTGEGGGPRGADGNRPIRMLQVKVIGSVQAGEWREAFEWAPEDQYTIGSTESDTYPGMPSFALEVRGDSMDQIFKDGWKVICIRFSDLGGSPQNGDYIICQRVDAGGAVEATLKRLSIRDDGVMWLVPESSNPEYQAIRLEAPSTPNDQAPLAPYVSAGSLANGEDVQIVALVDQFIGKM